MKKQNIGVFDRLFKNKEASAGKRKGFTLIEVLVAVFLVGVAVMGLAQIFTLTVLNNSRSDRIASATYLAQQRIDFLRNMTTLELNTATLSDGTPIPLDEQLDINNDGTLDYRRITQIQAAGFYWDIRVAVFHTQYASESAAQLLANPQQYRVFADMSTVISR
ncbi:MAG: prepilin-type N-terminal cleavage/methylation domain-containing protein [Candidatus Aminicenantes bacterium]|jgi:prepilin-type N-terminal cleavage/methylation domain-containing protein